MNLILVTLTFDLTLVTLTSDLIFDKMLNNTIFVFDTDFLLKLGEGGYKKSLNEVYILLKKNPTVLCAFRWDK